MCNICKGVMWVCENHTNKPWDASEENGCECGAGVPCVCNPHSASYTIYSDYATLAAAARRLVEAADMFVHRDRNTKDMPLRDGVLYSQKSYKGLLVALAEVEALLKEKTK